MAHLLHVYPVRDNASREGLRKLFSRCGFVVGVDKIGRGCALVGYREKAEAEQAMKTLKFTAFEGRVLQIKKSILFTEEHFASVREPNYGFCLRQFLCLDFNIYECINAVAGGQCLRGKHFCFHCLLQGLGHLPHRNRDDNCPSRQRGWEDKTQYKSAEERLGIPQAHSQQPRRTTSPSQALTAAPVEVPAAAQNSQQPVGSNPSLGTSPTDTAAPAVAFRAAAQNSKQSLGNDLSLDTSAAQNDPEDKLTYILFNDAKGWKPGYHDDVNALLQEQQHKAHVDVPRGSIVLLDNPNNDFDPARAVNVSVVDQPGVKVTALLNQMQAVSEEIVNLLRPAKYETRYQLITDSRRVPSLSCRLGEMVHFTPPGETNPIQAVVRYMGPVHTLGPGTRIGLQIMDEDWHFGDTNGTLAGRVYFEADENKGVFCHVGQITRIQKNEELTKMSQSVSVGRLVNEFNSYDSTKDQGNKRHNLTLSNNRHRNNFAETRQEQDRQPYRILHERDVMARSAVSGPAENQRELSQAASETTRTRSPAASSISTLEPPPPTDEVQDGCEVKVITASTGKEKEHGEGPGTRSKSADQISKSVDQVSSVTSMVRVPLASSSSTLGPSPHANGVRNGQILSACEDMAASRNDESQKEQQEVKIPALEARQTQASRPDHKSSHHHQDKSGKSGSGDMMASSPPDEQSMGTSSTAGHSLPYGDAPGTYAVDRSFQEGLEDWQCQDKYNDVINAIVCTCCGMAGHTSNQCRQKRPGSGPQGGGQQKFVRPQQMFVRPRGGGQQMFVRPRGGGQQMFVRSRTEPQQMFVRPRGGSQQMFVSEPDSRVVSPKHDLNAHPGFSSLREGSFSVCDPADSFSVCDPADSFTLCGPADSFSLCGPADSSTSDSFSLCGPADSNTSYADSYDRISGIFSLTTTSQESVNSCKVEIHSPRKNISDELEDVNRSWKENPKPSLEDLKRPMRPKPYSRREIFPGMTRVSSDLKRFGVRDVVSSSPAYRKEVQQNLKMVERQENDGNYWDRLVASCSSPPPPF